MKKKYGIAILSVLIIVVSTILLINKPSYAGMIPDGCPNNITVEESEDTLSLIKTDYLTITLPKNIEIKDTKEDTLALLPDRNTRVVDQVYESISGANFDIMIFVPQFSEDKEENRYYTQLAFWWLNDIMDGYQDEYNYNWKGDQLPADTTEEERYDEAGIYKYENQLSALEKKAIKESPEGEKLESFINEIKNMAPPENPSEEPSLKPIDTSKITYYATNDYIETNLITPTVEDEFFKVWFRNYRVKVENPITVVDENGKEKTYFKSTEGFKLRIPISEVKEGKINFEAQIIDEFKAGQWVEYFTKLESENQPQTRGTIPTEEIIINCGEINLGQLFKTQEINYKIEVGTLNIKVIDAESKEELSDAEVVIYDKSGNIVYRYKTTGDTLNITLPVGEYTVKQIITPPNYQARVVEQKVTITENGETDAVLENIQLIEVPDTGKTISNIIVFGTIITLIGISLILITFKRRKEAK